MYHKQLNINGTDYPIAVNITGAGAPTPSTEAEVGMFYMDTTTGEVYKCTAVSGSTYTWELFRTELAPNLEGNEADKAPSVKAVNEGLVPLKKVIQTTFDILPSVNLLNPQNAESGYYDTTTLALMASVNHMRTIKPISLEGHNGLVCHCTSIGADAEVANSMLCYCFMDSNGNLVRANSVTFASMRDNHEEYYAIHIPDNATQMHVWISGVNYGLSFSDVCISLEELDGFVECVDGAKVKDSALPDSVVRKDDLIVFDELAESIEAVSEAVEFVQSANLLNPENAESGYYDANTLAPMASVNHVRTVTPVSIEGHNGKIYIRTTLPNDTTYGSTLIFYAFLDSDGNKISHASNRVDVLNNHPFAELPMTATQMLVYTSNANYGVSLADWCLSFEELDDFVAYGKNVKLKESALPDNATRNLPFVGKTIVNFGDSIFGNTRPPNDISTKLAELTGATVHNCGFGGCRMAYHHRANYDAFSMYRIADAIALNDFALQDNAIVNGKTPSDPNDQIPYYFEESLALLKSIDFSKVDIVTIAYGTNDFTGFIPIENAENTHGTDTFAGAMRYSIERLLGAYPHLKIFVCGQTYRFFMESDGSFAEDSDTRVYNDVKLTDFVENTKDVAMEYHLPFIDNYYSLGLNKFNRQIYFPSTDGTHPNVTGNELIARHIAYGLF